MLKIDGEEVFLICAEGTDAKGYVTECADADDAKEHLLSLNPETDSDTVVLYGLVTSAEVLPPSLGDNNVFIIIREGLNPSTAEVHAFDGKSISGLAADIETYVSEGSLLNSIITIDDIQIMYGFSLELCLAIDDDAIAESSVEDIKASIMESEE